MAKGLVFWLRIALLAVGAVSVSAGASMAALALVAHSQAGAGAPAQPASAVDRASAQTVGRGVTAEPSASRSAKIGGLSTPIPAPSLAPAPADAAAAAAKPVPCGGPGATRPHHPPSGCPPG